MAKDPVISNTSPLITLAGVGLVVGAMTVLLRAKQQGLIPAVEPALATMLAQGRRLSTTLRAHVLRLAGESEG